MSDDYIDVDQCSLHRKFIAFFKYLNGLPAIVPEVRVMPPSRWRSVTACGMLAAANLQSAGLFSVSDPNRFRQLRADGAGRLLTILAVLLIQIK